MDLENQSVYYTKFKDDENHVDLDHTRKIKIVHYVNLGLIVCEILFYLILTATLWNQLAVAKLNGPFVLWLFSYVIIFLLFVCLFIAHYWKRKNIVRLSLQKWIIVLIIVHLFPVVFVIIPWIALWIATAMVSGKGYSESTELFLQFFIVFLGVFFELWILLVVITFFVVKRWSDKHKSRPVKRMVEIELQAM